MTLPPELDFAANREASPARMNLAMEYLLGVIRPIAALKPELEKAIADVEANGLLRLTERLLPIFAQAEGVRTELEQLRDAWLDDNILDDLKTEITGERDTAIAAALVPIDSRLDTLEAFDTGIAAAFDRRDLDRWFFNHR